MVTLLPYFERSTALYCILQVLQKPHQHALAGQAEAPVLKDICSSCRDALQPALVPKVIACSRTEVLLSMASRIGNSLTIAIRILPVSFACMSSAAMYCADPALALASHWAST